MKTIIVSGGAGFIGSNFVYHLMSREPSSRIVVYDKLTYAGSKLSLEKALRSRSVFFVKGDIADAPAVRSLYRRYQPAGVLNFAAESHVDRSIEGPGAFVATNLVGTFRLLEEARRYWAALKGTARKNFRFLNVSTDEVYGTLGQTGFFRETTPYAPNSPYAATKAGADHLVRAYHETYGLPVLLTNCSNNFGPFQFPEKLVPLLLLNALEAKSLPVYGDGRNVRDWVYVEDHCEALFKVLAKGKPGERYNVGGGHPKTNLEVVAALCRQLEKKLPARRNPAMAKKGMTDYSRLVAFVKDRPGHDRRYAIDSSKIRGELGWKPRHSFERGLEKTVEWYLAHPDWCRAVQAGKYHRQRLGLTPKKQG